MRLACCAHHSSSGPRVDRGPCCCPSANCAQQPSCVYRAASFLSAVSRPSKKVAYAAKFISIISLRILFVSDTRPLCPRASAQTDTSTRFSTDHPSGKRYRAFDANSQSRTKRFSPGAARCRSRQISHSPVFTFCDSELGRAQS
jgi:hypothetical protein